MITLYGIKNCNTVSKARKWLEGHDIDYQFHDFRADGLNHDQLILLAERIPWETLLNRRSTRWKDIPVETRENLDQTQALKFMLLHPTLIKRPVLISSTQAFVGFTESLYQQQLT
jgi:arsenate reductase (glutaredoxin)